MRSPVPLRKRASGADAGVMTSLAFYERHCAPVPGWFGVEDALLFDLFLRRPVAGDLLELGVYKGKSALLLGHALRAGETLHACDLFGSDDGRREGYVDHQRAAFEALCSTVLGATPTVWSMPSSEALAQLAAGERPVRAHRRLPPVPRCRRRHRRACCRSSSTAWRRRAR